MPLRTPNGIYCGHLTGRFALSSRVAFEHDHRQRDDRPPRDDPRLLDPTAIRGLVAELGLRPTKQRGQNFVTDANTVRRIVSLAEVTPDVATIRRTVLASVTKF